MKKAFTKKALLAFIPVLAAALTGCLEFHQIITLRQDGAATVSMTYAIPEAELPALTAMQATLNKNATAPGDKTQNAAWLQSANWFMNEKAVRDAFDKPQQKLRVLVYKTFRRDGKQFVEVIVEAKNALTAFNSGVFGPARLDDKSFSMRFPQSLDGLDGQNQEQLRKLCGDLSMEIELFTPADIDKTSGYKRGKRQAVWHFSANGRGIDIFGKLDDITATWQ